jgi:hypothetical protein
MPLRRLILGFLIWFVLIFGLLILPWPGWNEIYGYGFRAVGNAVFARDGEKRVLYFEAHRQTRGLSAIDTRITIGNRDLVDSSGKGLAAMLGLDTRSIGWLPTALTIALIVATPIPWQRRAWSLMLGLLLIHAFILFSVAIYIWNESTAVSLVTLSPFWKQIADALEYTLVTQMGISFTVPVLIWIAVLFRREDVKNFVLNQKLSPSSLIKRSGRRLKEPPHGLGMR